MTRPGEAPARAAALLLAAVLLLAGALRAEWTQFRGDASLSGVARDPLPASLALAWTFEAAEGIESSPAIAGGTVFVGSLDGHLYALDLATGKERFRYKAAGEIKSSPAVRDGIVYVGDEAGTFHAVDARRGTRRWTFETGAPVTSSPNFAAHGGGTRVLFGSYDRFLYALDAASGALAWKVETENYVHATPAVAGERVLVAGCDGFLRAVRVADGKDAGKVALGGYTAASPAVGGGRAYLGTFENEVLAVDLASLSVAWRFKDAEREFPFYASPAVGSLVVVGGRDKRVRALDPASGKERWSFTTPARVDASPVIAGDRVVAASLSGDLYVLSLGRGDVLWKYAAGGPLAASPAVADGHLVAATADGAVLAFAAPRGGARGAAR